MRGAASARSGRHQDDVGAEAAAFEAFHCTVSRVTPSSPVCVSVDAAAYADLPAPDITS